MHHMQEGKQLEQRTNRLAGFTLFLAQGRGSLSRLFGNFFVYLCPKQA